MKSDSGRWGVALLVLAVIVGLLDAVSATAPRATMIVICLLVAGSALLVSGAVSSRREPRGDRPSDP